MKYSKGIKVANVISILVTDKNSFEECDKEILEELEKCPISGADKKELIEKVLT